MNFLFLILVACASLAHANSYMPGDYEEVGFGEKSFMVAYPNPVLTPGTVVESATRETVCTGGYARHMRRSLSKADKAAIYDRYGLVYDSKHYQIDHFVPLSIGGSNDLQNLWPQPIQNNAGFLEKQQVANALHNRVCAGAISIRDAQALVKKDWHAVYIQMHGGKTK